MIMRLLREKTASVCTQLQCISPFCGLLVLEIDTIDVILTLTISFEFILIEMEHFISMKYRRSSQLHTKLQISHTSRRGSF